LAPILEQVFEQYPKQVKIVFKHFPLRNHAFAYKAAQAAVAAQQQGKFWPFHDLLFKQYSRINDQRIDEIGKLLKLDMSQFKKAMNAADTLTRINGDLANGREAGVGGTPTVFINGVKLKNRTVAGFEQAIAEALGAKSGDER
jgi:protein-disulfide isomerase